jgi:hypothetical protein
MNNKVQKLLTIAILSSLAVGCSNTAADSQKSTDPVQMAKGVNSEPARTAQTGTPVQEDPSLTWDGIWGIESGKTIIIKKVNNQTIEMELKDGPYFEPIIAVISSKNKANYKEGYETNELELNLTKDGIILSGKGRYQDRSGTYKYQSNETQAPQKKATQPVKDDQPVQTIKIFYQSAVDRDFQTFDVIGGQFKKMSPEAMSEISEMVMNAGGISKMKITKVNPEDLKEEVKKTVADKFGPDSAVVLEQDSFSHYVWVLKKVDNNYHIVEGDDTSLDQFLKDPAKYPFEK